MLKELRDDGFSPNLVSTTTVTANFKGNINIIDIAKYLPLDNVVIGIKLVYAGGSQTIISGVARLSKKKKDFYNQVTFTLRLPAELSDNRANSILVSCKIFHNGTLHVTGTHTLDEARNASNLLLERLEKFQGIKMVSLIPNCAYLKSKDNLIFSSDGLIIGWSDDSGIIYVKNEYVNLITLEGDDNDFVFVSTKWINNTKNIYDLDGNEIGKRHITFNTEISKRHFEVKFGYVYCGNKIVGKEHVDLFERNKKSEEYRKYLLEKKAVLHPFSSFLLNGQNTGKFANSDFTTHMINTFFKAPFKVCRKKIHKAFLDNGYYSRFEPCSHAAVNLRFHYNDSTKDDIQTNGKCVWKTPKGGGATCRCKDISVSIFNSGKMNVTGLSNLSQSVVLYDFLRYFFTKFRTEIIDNTEKD